MKNWISKICGLAAIILILTACSGGGTDSTDQTSNGSETSGSADSSAAQPLTVYTNSASDGRGDWLTEQASEAGFELEIVEAGGGDIFNRILAEKGNPQADIVFGLDESMFGQLKNEELLIQYEPEWIGEVTPDSNSEGFYAPIVEQRIFMIYNPEFVSADEAPDKWEDLSDNHAGQYKLPPNLTGGTNQKAVISILAQYRDDNGELGVSDEGWQVLQEYYDNGYMMSEDEDAIANFSDGTVPVSFTYSSGIPATEEEFGITVEPINPDYGVVSMNEQVGIINKNQDDYGTAEDFVNWFGSAKVQGAWAEQFGSYPANTEAQSQADERIIEIMDATTPMGLDWAWVTENLDGWIEKIELEIL